MFGTTLSIRKQFFEIFLLQNLQVAVLVGALASVSQPPGFSCRIGLDDNEDDDDSGSWWSES